VVSGSGDHIVRVWEVATGRVVASMTHDSNVRTVAFSRDGKYVVSGSRDNTVRVWEWAIEKEVTRIILADRVNSVAFSPDGKYVVSGAEDKVVRVWLWRSEDLIEKACARATRNLNRAEWRQYMGDVPYRAVCPDLPLEPEAVPTAAP